MKFVYIHGFNSGPESRSGQALEELLGKPVLRISNDYSQKFASCLRDTERQITSALGRTDDICAMGTSLGGFYALQLRLPNLAKVIAWNPVIYPAMQLAQFVGTNIRFTDNKKWDFSRQALLSYAGAPDPREWKNRVYYEKPMPGAPEIPCPGRYVFLGDHDELLDHELAHEYWLSHADISIIDSGHHIEDFGCVLDVL